MKNLHGAAGAVAMLTIATFWIATVLVEIFGDFETIWTIKQDILWGMLVLIPALIITGASGFRLAAKRGGRLVDNKKKRMPIIAVNGLIVLVPSAIFLASRASSGDFGAWFYAVQTLELIVGAVNFVLLGMNMRDGLRMSGKLSGA